MRKVFLLAAPGGISSQMKPVKPNVYETVADLGGKLFSVRGNNLGCKWSAKLP